MTQFMARVKVPHLIFSITIYLTVLPTQHLTGTEAFTPMLPNPRTENSLLITASVSPPSYS